MQIAVIGAGVVGVTTAYELAVRGHEVAVFERRNSVAAECTFANAGVMAAGYTAPWAAGAMVRKLLRHALGRDKPVHLAGWGAWAFAPWLWRGWRSGRPAARSLNRRAMQGLAQFSRDRTLELTRSLGLEFEQAQGYTVLLRGERELADARPTLDLLRELGVSHELADAARCRQLEPALNPATSLVAALHLPQDGVGNCRQFSHLLKAEAQRLGAVFRFDTDVRALAAGPRPVVQTAGGEQWSFDAVVVCAGAQANDVLASVGIKLPLAPVHGYSITAPMRHVEGLGSLGPRAGVMDERYKVAISRLGQRIRVSGLAEFGGDTAAMRPAPLRTLYGVLEAWFPGSTKTHEAQHWKGARPMLPDGPPVLGASDAPGVWLNLGHGASGWALACGSACVLAEQIDGRAAPVDVGRLGVERLR